MAYEALGNLKAPQFVQFSTERFEQELEFTGHFVAHLNISATRHRSDAKDQADFMDLDLFLTIRHISGNNTEILYTGTVGDPVPVTKGWLRASLRKTNLKRSRHQHWHPHREYVSTDGNLLSPGQVYEVDVEIWPSNVIVDKGARLVFEVSSGDTQGAGLFEHNSLDDRAVEIFAGMNHIHFGDRIANWLLLPEIPRTIEPQPYATN